MRLQDSKVIDAVNLVLCAPLKCSVAAHGTVPSLRIGTHRNTLRSCTHGCRGAATST